MRVNINVFGYQRVGRLEGPGATAALGDSGKLQPPPATPAGSKPAIAEGKAEPHSALETSDKLHLTRAAAAEVARGQGALDAKGGVVVTLATALAFASAVQGRSQAVGTTWEPVWAALFVIFAAIAIATGVVSLLIRSIGVNEPGMRIVHCHVERTGTKELLEIELLWLHKAHDGLNVRKKWLLASYASLLASGISVFFAIAFGFII